MWNVLERELLYSLPKLCQLTALVAKASDFDGTMSVILFDTPSRMWHLILGIWCPPMCVSWGILRSTKLVHRKLLYLVSSDNKQGVTNKQEEGRLIGVCVGVWITFHQPIPAKEPIELWLGNQIPFRGDIPQEDMCTRKRVCFHLLHFLD